MHEGEDKHNNEDEDSRIILGDLISLALLVVTSRESNACSVLAFLRDIHVSMYDYYNTCMGPRPRNHLNAKDAHVKKNCCFHPT